MDQKLNFDFSIPMEVDQEIEPNTVSTTATTHGLDPERANAQLMNNNSGGGDASDHDLNQMGSAFEGSGQTAANQTRSTTNLSGTPQNLSATVSMDEPGGVFDDDVDMGSAPIATSNDDTTDHHPYQPYQSDSTPNPHGTPQSLMSPMSPRCEREVTPTPGTSGNNVKVQLQNIVSTVNLSCKLDLKRIVMRARNAEYNPRRFAAVIMRIREPRTTALIFSSGKLVCTGAKTAEDSRVAARKYARIVQKLGFPARFLDFKVQNFVGSCDVRFPIRLEGLALSHDTFCSYEPELFPGLIYRMVEPRITLLIFVSGKVVLTGAQKPEELDQAFEKILPVLQKYKKKSSDN